MKSEINKTIQFSDNLSSDTHAIIEHAQISAYKVVDTILVQRNWLLGKRIAIEILKGKDRAEYGEEVISRLSKDLSETYGKGFTKTNLYSFVKFNEYFPNIFHAASGESNGVIFHAMSGKSYLSWTHYRTLLQVPDQKARYWYEKEASKEMWSSRTLQRNIASQYYYRMLKTYDKESVHDEMVNITSATDNKLELPKFK